MYTLGADFNCKGTSCYGVGKGPDGTFRRLQQGINTAASVLKLPLKTLTVDGLIGPQTVTNLVEIGKRAQSEYLRMLVSKPNVQTAAALAVELIAELASVPSSGGSKLPVPPTSTPVKPPVPVPPSPQAQVPVPSNPYGTTYPVPVSPPAQPGYPASPPRPNRQIWWVVGGALGAAVLIGVGFAVYTQQRVNAQVDGPDLPDDDEDEAPG